MSEPDAVCHPAHYGGEHNPYEAIKVIEAWGLGFCLGNTIKYIARHKAKGAPLEDLKKARFYLDREIANAEADAAAKTNDGPEGRCALDDWSRGTRGYQEIVIKTAIPEPDPNP